MPGDPKECRQHALSCMLLAKQATSDEAKHTFINLAHSWTALAVDLEQVESILHASSEIDISSTSRPVSVSPTDDGNQETVQAKPGGTNDRQAQIGQ
jgi:hypothetical protein